MLPGLPLDAALAAECENLRVSGDVEEVLGPAWHYDVAQVSYYDDTIDTVCVYNI